MAVEQMEAPGGCVLEMSRLFFFLIEGYKSKFLLRISCQNFKFGEVDLAWINTGRCVSHSSLSWSADSISVSHCHRNKCKSVRWCFKNTVYVRFFFLSSGSFNILIVLIFMKKMMGCKKEKKKRKTTCNDHPQCIYLMSHPLACFLSVCVFTA